MLRFLTAGESHGRGLVVIVDGLPAGVQVLAGDLEAELARRRRGHGRGARMRIERDEITILAGVRYGMTTGSRPNRENMPSPPRHRDRDTPTWRG